MADAGEMCEPEIVAQVCKNSGADVNLFLSSSMPIRWADMYAKANAGFPRVIVNRGANGIDGIISTASGVARASEQTTVCILGDLTFLHDPNGLWRLRVESVPLKLIVLNNNGGGVFHFLPVALHSEHFENLVAMPHGIEISHLAAAYGITYTLANSSAHFSELFDASLTRPGPEIIEVRTDRAGNYRRHQEVIEQVKCAARSALGLA
jgi:2-succinyl-5-enolpyruvyl-6-hydroxy-3-cyclohexene-1-carboxylate synthase